MKSKLSPAWISVAAVLILWQLAADRIQHPALFPSVIQLSKGIGVLLAQSAFYESVASTILRALEAFLLAMVIAVPASVVALHSSFWKSFFHPLVVIMRSIPVIAVVLIALLLLTPSGLPIIIGCITMLPILYQNFLSAWENTDPQLVEMARFYRKSLLQRFRYVYFMQSRDLLFAGLATAVGFGWRAIIIGEVLSSPSMGIGALMKKSQAYIDMPGLLAWTLMAIAGGFVAEYLIKKIAKIKASTRLKQGNGKNDNHPVKANRTIEIYNLSFLINSKHVLKNISLSFNNSTIVLLQSPSGSGKTTLLNLLSGQLKPTDGKIQRTHIQSCSISYQDKRLLPGLTIEQNIAFADIHFPALTVERHNRLDTLLKILELESLRLRFPGELSGGEQQRVALARALLIQADLLLLDEPLTGIGNELKNAIIRFIEEDSNSYQPLIVWATHEKPEEVLTVPTRRIQELSL